MVTRLVATAILATWVCLLCVFISSSPDGRRGVGFGHTRLNSVPYRSGFDGVLRANPPTPLLQEPARQVSRHTLQPKTLKKSVRLRAELKRLLKAMQPWPITSIEAPHVSYNPRLPKACLPLPDSKASYIKCMQSLYSAQTDAIKITLEHEFSSVKECSGLTLEECAVYLYSTVPLWHVTMEQCGNAVIGATMKDLYLMAEVLRQKAKNSGIECIMLDSMDLNVQILGESTSIARDLYVTMVDEGNPALLHHAKTMGMSNLERAQLAVNYRNWAKQFLRDEIMRNTFHNDWGTEILYLRDEAKYGTRKGISFDKMKVGVCKKIGMHDCDNFDTLPAGQQERVFQYIESATKTNPAVNRITHVTP